MQVVDKDGNVFGSGLQVNGPDGKPKTSSGGGSPSGPAGGDLYGTYPNPGVDWNLGISTYSMYYYPLSSNPAGYLNAISGSMVTSAVGYTPYDASNPAGYIDSSALTPYLTSATAAATYQPLLTLTTTGSSGPATLTGSTLNIPQYGGGLTIGTTAITSGTVGRILFEGTGNVLQQSANLFWDNTNGRLGIGTATPSTSLNVIGGAEEIATEQIAAKFSTSTTGKELAIGLVNLSGKYWKLRSLSDGSFDLRNITDSRTTFSSTSNGNISIWGNTFFNNNSNSITNTGGINGLWLQKAGSYTTSNYSICSDSTATFINAVGGGIFFRNNNSSQGLIASTGNFLIGTTTDAGFKLNVNGTARVQSGLTISGQTANNYLTIGTGTGNAFFVWSSYFLGVTGVKFRSEYLIGDPSGAATNVRASAAIDSRGYLVTDSIGIGTTTNTINASAIAQIDSTTKGFLPPRMTNAQMLAIATPAAGLVVYDTTNNKHCGYNGTAWQNFY